MRMIDADNLKIRLEEAAKQINQKFNEYGLRPDIINWVIDEMTTVEQSRWIPVSERLPKKYAEVLISVNYKYNGEIKERYTDVGTLTDKEWVFVRNFYQRLNEFNEIVAWMPFPEPYEE